MTLVTLGYLQNRLISLTTNGGEREREEEKDKEIPISLIIQIVLEILLLSSVKAMKLFLNIC